MGPRKKINKKKLLIELLVVILLCLVLIIEINMFYRGLNPHAEKADVIIILGCSVWGDDPSPTLEQRIYRAFELYQKKYAKKIIATGSKGYGENISEAEAAKRRLVQLGVPEKDILEETKSTNTVENMNFAKEIMQKNHFNNAIVVTNYYHIYRSSLISHDLGIKACFAKAPMPRSIANRIFSNIREVLSVIKYFCLSSYSNLKGIFSDETNTRIYITRTA